MHVSRETGERVYTAVIVVAAAVVVAVVVVVAVAVAVAAVVAAETGEPLDKGDTGKANDKRYSSIDQSMTAQIRLLQLDTLSQPAMTNPTDSKPL